MKYLISLILGTILTAILYYSPIFLLSPSPVAADYWIREMMVIKKNISLAHKDKDKNKIIILSGSNALFSIDTNTISQEFNLPVINYGLMSGLPIETLFNEMNEIIVKGDSIILPLEPDFYCKEEIEGFREFEVRNAIAWNFTYWKGLSLIDKISSIRFMNSKFPLEIIEARLVQKFKPESISPRIHALNDNIILDKFNDPLKNIDVNLYSIYNVDSLGNIKNSNDSHYRGTPRRADIDIKVCSDSINKITNFRNLMEKKGVAIYFANPPFVKLDDLNYQNVTILDSKFKKTLSSIAPVIDSRNDLIFPLSSFLNTELHLNSMGRALRTNILIESIKKYNIIK